MADFSRRESRNFLELSIKNVELNDRVVNYLNIKPKSQTA